MAWSSFLFTVSSKFRQSSSRYKKTRLVNMRHMRVLVRNEEVSSRYVRSFYIEPGEMLEEIFKKDTVFYFWEKNTLLKECSFPRDVRNNEVSIVLKSDGTLTVA